MVLGFFFLSRHLYFVLFFFFLSLSPALPPPLPPPLAPLFASLVNLLQCDVLLAIKGAVLQWAVEPSGGGWTESMLQRVSSGVHFSPSSDEQFYMTRRVCVCVLHVPRCFIWWAWLCWRSSSSWRTAVVTMTSCLTTPPKLHVSNKTQSYGVQFSYLIGRLWRKKHHTLTHCLFVFILCVCVCVCRSWRIPQSFWKHPGSAGDPAERSSPGGS